MVCGFLPCEQIATGIFIVAVDFFLVERLLLVLPEGVFSVG